MGEVSKALVLVLALAVIVISVVGTLAVMNAAMDVFGGTKIAVAGGESSSAGIVRVRVNGTPPGPISGMVSVMVNDVV